MAARDIDVEGRKVEEVPAWHVRCNDDRRLRGYDEVSFLFLAEWLGEELGYRFLLAARRIASRQRGATTMYDVRIVLQDLRTLRPDASSWQAMDGADLVEALATLRHRLVLNADQHGRSLHTAAAKWNAFLRNVPHFIATNAFPSIDIGGPRIRRIPKNLVSAKRSELQRIAATPALAPRSLDRASDSYNNKLFEPLSIGATEVEYIEEYRSRLENAIQTIRAVAIKEFEELEKKHRDCRKLMKKAAPYIADDASLEMLEAIDPDWLRVDSDHHEIALGALLHFVHKKMDGVPKPWAKDREYATEIPENVSRRDCLKLATYGKNRLLPYLGIMTTQSSLICMIILMIEHPKLNPTTISRAKLSDGRRLLFTTETVNEESATRFTGVKRRAHAEKSLILSPLAARVMERAQEWTAAAREILRSEGDSRAANRLWVGMTLRDYKVRAFGHDTIVSGIKQTQRTYGKVAEPDRLTTLVERNPELKRWAKPLTLKNLRINCGVLEYLRSNGDASRAAEVFGNRVQTALDDYIPIILQHALYERQIRRHQNLLIAASFGKEGPPLEATDFNTTQELNKFLSGVFENLELGDDQPLASALAKYLKKRNLNGESAQTAAEQCVEGRLVLNSDPRYLTIAMLYRDHVRDAPEHALNAKDPGTKIAPRFWVDFVDSLVEELPNAHVRIRKLVQKARDLKIEVARTIDFPRTW